MKQATAINQQQTDILLFLYRFRFLTRSQIQKLLTHKFHSKVIAWLNELTQSQYVNKHQSSNSAMIYYSLGKVGRKYLITNRLVKQTLLLNRVWREAGYTILFRDKCVLIADVYLDLKDRFGGALRFWTKIDLAGMKHLPEPKPDAYGVIDGKSEADRFFIEVPTYSRTINVTEQIDRHAEYFFSNEWQENVSKDVPQAIIVCSNKSAIKSANRYIKAHFADEPDLRFRVASSDQALVEILPKKKA